MIKVFMLLPLLFFIALFLYLFGRHQENAPPLLGWRGTFLQACLVWGGLVTVFSEFLSIINMLSALGLAVLWGISLIGILLYGWRVRAFHRGWQKIKMLPWRRMNRWDGLILTALVAIAGLLFAIAWRAVPNTTDSLLYHMSRVMHWAQNGSLKHYPTQYHHQIMMPIWAETAILNLRLLWGNDQFANLVQWFSMVGSLIGVSAIAGLLGAGRRDQLLAASFVAGIPMGILQATSTQNDYVTAFWMVCLTYFVLLGKKRELIPLERVCLALATGLGMLTKVTFYPYAFFTLLWFFVPRFLTRRWRRFLIEISLFAGIVVTLNSGYWTRNLITYGWPLGPRDWSSFHVENLAEPRMWIPDVIKHVAINFSSTIPEVNDFLVSSVESAHDLMGLELHDFGAFPWWNWNHEDLAANPLHMLSVFVSSFALLLAWPRTSAKFSIRYALVVFLSFCFVSVFIGFHMYVIRFHLPFFVLWGAVYGAAAFYSNFKQWSYVTAVLIFIASAPWLIMNRTRCLFAYVPYTYLGSNVLFEQPDKILFANWHALREPYKDVAEAVISTDCLDVGLKIDSSDLEYPYWWLLEAPQSGYRIESLEVRSQSERYIDPDFKPCAIICSVCGDRQRLHGLERVGDFGEGLVLYTGSDYTEDEDG